MSVLIIGQSHDGHVEAVVDELADRDVEVTVADLTEFPRDGSMSVRYTCCGERSSRLDLPSGSLDLAAVRSVWWRRPQQPRVDEAITDQGQRMFALNEAAEALAGLWPTLDARWINDPGRDQVAHRKIHQLRVAQDVGLRVPDTLITNDPAQARAFVDRHGYTDVIYKAFSATPELWRETRLLREAELAQLEEVSLTPVIFQSYVEAVHDLRITAVGDRLFAAAIGSQATSYPVDFRMDMGNAVIEPAVLPDEVQERLHALMARLGLVYGAIDMRRRPDGEYVFLEINPAGQWLFTETETQQPITAALADELAAADRSGPAPGRSAPLAVA